VQCWCEAFRWFVNQSFVQFYHKISGESIQILLGDMEYFKQAILDHLAQPVHPIERELFDNLGHPERVQYVIHCLIESWHVYGFLDDTAICTCRPGFGPIGPDEGPR
jgi:hypothetical protein